MRIRVGDDWQKDYLDYPLQPGQCRIEVETWNAVEPISGQYIQYGASDWRKVFEYIRQIGLLATVRKVYSRLGERHRNEKWLSVGVGTIMDSRRISTDWDPQTAVAFLAYNHPKAAERVCIDERFVASIPGKRSRRRLRFFQRGLSSDTLEVLEQYKGWSPFSEAAVKCDEVRSALRDVGRELGNWKHPEDVCKPNSSGGIEERRVGGRPSKGTCDAVLFGLGNYAKTVIMPNLPEELEVSCIHEVDPLQLGNRRRPTQTLDTSPELRPDENYDVAFIAGYHHTHTPLAVDMLNQGAIAVTEKPFCTTERQYRKLKNAIVNSSGRFFGCFHKRYSPLTEWVVEDLDLPQGRPAHYHAIVYEIPLPALHWYNWPASGSRIISNGCHWLDHFMYLNDYSKVADTAVEQFGTGDLMLKAELENGATFSMTLTEQGSSRLGVRDHVEVRTRTKTAWLIDNCDYQAEGSTGIIRSKSVNQMESYDQMYQSIGEAILEDCPGDDARTLRSTKMMLDLEEKLQS